PIRDLHPLDNLRIFRYSKYTRAMPGTHLDFYPDDWKKIPIKTASSDKQNVFTKIVNQLLQPEISEKEFKKLKSKIDFLVYKLYQLNYDEVLVIDPAFPLSKEAYENYEIESET
ncbi:hypothetical protein KC799_26000, partial [candidate division KSB1 bacterium]|nr:hypothetical protein [candidate division KSB1 bacterium]